jgi:hypothetical protein
MALIRLLLSSCTTLNTVLLIRHRALPEIKSSRQGGIASPSWLMNDEKSEIICLEMGFALMLKLFFAEERHEDYIHICIIRGMPVVNSHLDMYIR